jgi:hypothetical protein
LFKKNLYFTSLAKFSPYLQLVTAIAISLQFWGHFQAPILRMIPLAFHPVAFGGNGNR